jgi:hypothetical protein
MTPEVSDALSAFGSLIGGLAALAAVVIAQQQLRQVNRSLRHSSLATLLTIESEMNNRKQEAEKAACELLTLANRNAPWNEIEIANRHLEGCMESWMNAVDRFAYCIRKKLLREKDWKSEYLPYIRNLLVDHPERFRHDTIYDNTRKLAIRWGLQVPG